MSKWKRRKQAAARRGVHAYRAFDLLDRAGYARLPHWDVYVESEWILGPRELKLSRREAVNFAYRISVAKKFKITVTPE